MDFKKLNNNEKIPFISFGVFDINPEDTKKAVLDALDVGYRSFDNAQVYYNEKEVGQAISESEIPRDDLYLTTKVWVSNSGYDKTIKSVNKSLEDLQTDYLDLLLLHVPFGDYYGSYRALQDLQKEGKALSIVVSNFDPARLLDLDMHNDVTPQVNQVETSPFYQQYEPNEMMKKLGVAHQSWGPLGDGENNLFTNPILVDIAEKYGKTTAQVIFRCLIDRDIPFSCKSIKPHRMKENIDLFDFKLNKKEIEKIRQLDSGEDPFEEYFSAELVEDFCSEIV